MKVLRFLPMAVLVVAGCHGMANDEQIDGPYRLVATDIDEQMHVAYDLGDGVTVGRIPETVFAVGSDARYIVAAQHPDNDRTTTQYFYLVRALDTAHADPSVAVRGPLDRAAFEAEVNRLGLPPLTVEIESLK